jgi:polar amino acid transport system permease protein
MSHQRSHGSAPALTGAYHASSTIGKMRRLTGFRHIYAGCFSTIAILMLTTTHAVANSPGDSVVNGVLKWMPLMFEGFLFNILISLLAMAVGTAAGILLSLAQLSLIKPVRMLSWTIMQFFRNAPWLVILFYCIYLLPFEIRIGGLVIPLPGWIKAIVGLALPVMANVSEIVRGSVQSIPVAQWESAESLAFTRRQTLWMIILPQCLKRMLPPWMNLYAVLTMATPLVSIVGVQDAMTATRAALAAEARSDLLIPMYGILLFWFFIYCYPIARWTAALERRFHVKT